MKPKSTSPNSKFNGLAVVLMSLFMAATVLGQTLVIGSSSTYSGAGTYTIKGNITNPGVAAATSIAGTVTMSGTAGQTIGTATNGPINFSTLNINTSAGTKTTTAAVATAVSTNLAIAAASIYDIGTNTLQIDAASSIGAAGALAFRPPSGYQWRFDRAGHRSLASPWAAG